MTVSPEIAAQQAAYQSRPFAARIRTSHFSATFRFDSEAEAIEYIMQQYCYMAGNIANGERCVSMRLDGWLGCQIVTPEGEYDAKYALLAADLNSY
jgi:hypothetical protein